MNLIEADPFRARGGKKTNGDGDEAESDVTFPDG